MVSKSDQLVKLSPIKFGPLILPVISIANTITPRFETNSYQGAKADYLRTMGFSSRSFGVELLFDANLGTYPDTYRKFLIMVNNNKALKLSHPILGDILCFISSYSDSLDPSLRSGVKASATFTETLEGEASELVQLKSANVQTFSEFEIQAASELPELEDDDDLFDSLADISASINQLKNLPSNSFAKINSAKNKLKNSVNNVIDTFKTANDTASILAIAAMRKKLDFYSQEENEKTILNYRTEKDVGIYELATKLGTTGPYLTQMNPNLSGKLIILKNTVVYY